MLQLTHCRPNPGPAAARRSSQALSIKSAKHNWLFTVIYRNLAPDTVREGPGKYALWQYPPAAIDRLRP